MRFILFISIFSISLFAQKITFQDEYDNNVTLNNEAKKVALFPIPLASFSIAVDGNTNRIQSINPIAKDIINQGILGKIFKEANSLNTTGINADFSPNIEELIKADLDFIVQWGSFGSELYEPLKKLGIAMALIKFKGEENTIKWFEMLGKAYKQEERVNSILKHRAEIRKNIEQMKFKNQPKIAMFSSSAGKLNLAGKDTYHDWAINLIGAKNIAKHQGFRLVEPETFLALNPDIIFIASTDKTEPKYFYNNKIFSKINAVKNKKVYKMPNGGFRWDPPSQESPLSWLWMTSMTHNIDLDIKRHMQEMYSFLYNYNLSENDMDLILQIDVNKNSSNYLEFFGKKEDK